MTKSGFDRGAWEPINCATPAKWHRFIGRRIGATTFGIAAAFGPTALLFGVELITGQSRGVAVCIGPFWIGVAALRNQEQAA